MWVITIVILLIGSQPGPPPPQTPLIESLWPLIVGIWGFSEDSWGSRKFGVRVANFGAVIKGCWR